MKSKVLKFLRSGGNNSQRRTLTHVVLRQPKGRKRFLVPGTLASLAIVISGLAIFFALELATPTRAINGFSTNQALPLPPLPPIGPAPVALMGRGLWPNVWSAPDSPASAPRLLLFRSAASVTTSD